MNRRVISAVLAVVLASAGTFVLVAYVRSAEQRALAGEQTTTVFVVSEAIEKGTPGEAIRSRVTETSVPAKVRAADAVTDLDELEGNVAAVDLVAGEQLLASRFVSPAAYASENRIDVPEGSQLVTVELEPQRAVGNQLRPGDRVGFFASFTDAEDGAATHLTLHKLLVAGVQTNDTAQEESEEGDVAAAPASTLFVTLAVEAEVAERVVFAAEHGSVWLSLEPAEAVEDGTRIQTMETIFQ
jgi:pilus assembly protein CpaB